MTTLTATRRAFLGAVAGSAVGVGFAGTAATQDAGLASWFEDVSNATEIVDRRGNPTVEITVGATGNGGNYAYGPAAVRVDAGTIVVWT